MLSTIKYGKDLLEGIALHGKVFVAVERAQGYDSLNEGRAKIEEVKGLLAKVQNFNTRTSTGPIDLNPILVSIDILEVRLDDNAFYGMF